MFDLDDDFGPRKSDNLDDFDYYFDYIKALEEEQVTKGFIVQELMSEFDLKKDEAVKILKRYYSEKSQEDDTDEYDDTVEDDDYGDGNTEY